LLVLLKKNTQMTHLLLRQTMCHLQAWISATTIAIEKSRHYFSQKNSVFKSFQHENTLLALLEYSQTNLTTKNYLKNPKNQN
jgi:hypothetical protein